MPNKLPLAAIRATRDIQEHNLSDGYMIGLYNGLEICLATFEDREPLFKENVFKTKTEASERTPLEKEQDKELYGETTTPIGPTEC